MFYMYITESITDKVERPLQLSTPNRHLFSIDYKTHSVFKPTKSDLECMAKAHIYRATN